VVSRDDLRKKVLAAFKYEPCCEGAIEFEITRHEPNEMGVNVTVRLLSPHSGVKMLRCREYRHWASREGVRVGGMIAAGHLEFRMDETVAGFTSGFLRSIQKKPGNSRWHGIAASEMPVAPT